MKVLVIGANGQIGTKVVDKLLDSKHTPVAMVRKEADIPKFKEKGAEVVLADLEEEIDHAFDGIDAVVFTAGSGAHTGKDKTDLVDRKGAIKAIDKAAEYGADRFIMVSAFGADFDPSEWSDSMAHYYSAKSDADDHLMESDLDYTILKPGRLTNESGKDRIDIGKRIEKRGGSIPREDVATTIVQIIDQPNTFGGSFELLEGDTAIEEAVSRED